MRPSSVTALAPYSWTSWYVPVLELASPSWVHNPSYTPLEPSLDCRYVTDAQPAPIAAKSTSTPCACSGKSESQSASKAVRNSTTKRISAQENCLADEVPRPNRAPCVRPPWPPDQSLWDCRCQRAPQYQENQPERSCSPLPSAEARRYSTERPDQRRSWGWRERHRGWMRQGDPWTVVFSRATPAHRSAAVTRQIRVETQRWWRLTSAACSRRGLPSRVIRNTKSTCPSSSWIVSTIGTPSASISRMFCGTRSTRLLIVPCIPWGTVLCTELPRG